jgi:hypothetical protein
MALFVCGVLKTFSVGQHLVDEGRPRAGFHGPEKSSSVMPPSVSNDHDGTEAFPAASDRYG